MGIASPPNLAKLIGGILISSPFEIKTLLFNRLKKRFGPMDMISREYTFDKTDYYTEEMGSPLFRYFVSFETLVPPETLPEIKLISNDIESEFLNEHRGRKVNVDPGILTLQNIVLATTKNYAHRIYLGKGIYGDLTLMFQKGQYSNLPWTYPDYRDEETRLFFRNVRDIYKNQLKEIKT